MGEKKEWTSHPLFGALVVPVAILLMGGAVVFGVARLLQSEKGHRELVRELQSKTFGNRWIAALELAKAISGQRVAEEEIPGLVADLEDIYSSSKDPRTRNFVVVAAGALRDHRALPLLVRGLDDPSSEVSFRALTALGNMKGPLDLDWSRVREFLHSPDPLVQQAAILTLATHQVKEAEEELIRYLNHPDPNLRNASAMALSKFKNAQAVPRLREILLPESRESDPRREALALNVLNILSENGWDSQGALIQQVEREAKNLKVVSAARGLLEKWGVPRLP